MTLRKSKSAAEYLEELNADPQHVARRSAQEDARALQEAKIGAASLPLLKELAATGYPVTTLDELLPRYAPLPKAVVEVLLANLTTIEDIRVQEQIVRALGAAAVPFDGTPLVRLFKKTESVTLRYALANTMAQGQPRGIAPWIVEAVGTPSFGTARQMLALAAARHAKPAQANAVLLGLLEDLPGHAAVALAESGRQREMEVLQAKYADASGWVQKEIGRAVSVIRRRVDAR